MASLTTCTPSTSRADSQTAHSVGMTDQRLKSYIDRVPKNLNKAFGRWLILPEMSSIDEYRATEKKIMNIAKKNDAEFKGTFVPTTEFGKYEEGDRIPFTLLDRETPVGQIKYRISELAHVPESEIMIGFQGKRNLDDNTNFRYDLNCNGRGGENFWISRNETKADIAAKAAFAAREA